MEQVIRKEQQATAFKAPHLSHKVPAECPNDGATDAKIVRATSPGNLKFSLHLSPSIISSSTNGTATRKHGGLLLGSTLRARIELDDQKDELCNLLKIREGHDSLSHIFQLQVVEQHNNNCCGYYALHNSCVVLEALEYDQHHSALSHLQK